LDWVPPSLVIRDLKPGDSDSATFTLHNDNPVPIELQSATFRQGELFTGSDPLIVDFALSASDACPQNPNALPPGATATVTLTASLPATAGNEYQGLSGIAVLSVTATEASGCGATTAAPDDELAITGLDVTLPTLIAIALLLVGGVIRSRRRRIGSASNA
ncbi:hypothetical protein, partial [Agromyces sp. S2-1-8]|uniref:hypothetical protein n=1 Tax=Agromyces sp. S2-1-8 TaxID=2897180 RepID=UPI001E4D1A6E